MLALSPPAPVLLLPRTYLDFWITTLNEGFGYSKLSASNFDKTWIKASGEIAAPAYEGYAITHGKLEPVYSNLYHIELSPGVSPMCGEDWLDKHWNNLKDYQPSLELILPREHYVMRGNPKQVCEATKAIMSEVRKEARAMRRQARELAKYYKSCGIKVTPAENRLEPAMA